MINVTEFKRKVIDEALSGQLLGEKLIYENKEFIKIANIYTGESTNDEEKKKYSVKVDNCYPYVATKDISMDGKVNYENGMYIPKNISKFSIAPANAILLCIEGGNAGNKIAVLDQQVCFVNKLCCFDVFGADNRFIYYYLLSNQFRNNFKSQMTGLIGGVSVKKIKSLLIPLPKIEEQKRIVAKLDEIFAELDRIDADQNKLVALQDKLEDKLLSLAIQGKLVEQRPEEGTGDELLNKLGKKVIDYAQTEDLPFDIPNSWVWCKLSDIGSTNIGLTYHPQDVVDKGTLVIRSSNIVDGKMDYTDKVCVNCQIKENQYVKNNDIVICSRNGSKRLVGKNAIYKGESNKYAFGAFMAIFRTEFYDFVHLYFNTSAFKRYFETDDSKQINQVTQAILKDSLIPLPPLEEQKRIIAKLNELLPQVKSF